MKTNSNIFLVLLSLLLISSCADNAEMLTIINPDGSCSREFYAEVDSAFMLGDTQGKHNPFPVEVDSFGKISWRYGEKTETNFPLSDSEYNSIKKNDDSKFTVLLKYEYKSVDEMADQFRLKAEHEWSDMNIDYYYSKKFRWFYTYFEYIESFPQIKHNFKDIEKYLNQEEITYWFIGQPNLLKGMSGLEANEFLDQLEEKYGKWIAYNYWNSYYDFLEQNYTKIKTDIPIEHFSSLRDSVFSQSGFTVFTDEEMNVDEVLDGYFQTNAFSLFFKSEKETISKFENDFWEQDFMKYFNQSFTYKLVMPGEILEAENAVNENDTLIWRLTAYRMITDDYAIKAVARRINIWAFALTGVVFLIAVGSFFLKRKS